MGTIQAELLKLFVDELRPTLRQRGFRKVRNTFNRMSPAAVAQVMAFQLPRIDPPTLRDPGYRDPNLGKFWLSLGIAPVGLGTTPAPYGRFVTEAWCLFRLNPGRLLPEPRDMSWDLTDPDQAVEEFHEVLASVEAWFEQADTPEKILGLLESPQPPRTFVTARRWLEACEMRLARGEKDAAQRNLDVQATAGALRPGQYGYLLEYAEARGLSLPDDRIVMAPH